MASGTSDTIPRMRREAPEAPVVENQVSCGGLMQQSLYLQARVARKTKRYFMFIVSTVWDGFILLLYEDLDKHR